MLPNQARDLVPKLAADLVSNLAPHLAPDRVQIWYPGRSIVSGPRWPIGAPGGFLMPGCPDAWIARMAKIARMAELDCPDARMAKIARIPMASGHGQQPWPVAMANGHGHGRWPWPLAMGIRAIMATRASKQSNSAAASLHPITKFAATARVHSIQANLGTAAFDPECPNGFERTRA